MTHNPKSKSVPQKMESSWGGNTYAWRRRQTFRRNADVLACYWSHFRDLKRAWFDTPELGRDLGADERPHADDESNQSQQNLISTTQLKVRCNAPDG